MGHHAVTRINYWSRCCRSPFPPREAPTGLDEVTEIGEFRWKVTSVSEGIWTCCPRVTAFTPAPAPPPVTAPMAAPLPPPKRPPRTAPTAAPPPVLRAVFLPRPAPCLV